MAPDPGSPVDSAIAPDDRSRRRWSFAACLRRRRGGSSAARTLWPIATHRSSAAAAARRRRLRRPFALASRAAVAEARPTPAMAEADERDRRSAAAHWVKRRVTTAKPAADERCASATRAMRRSWLRCALAPMASSGSPRAQAAAALPSCWPCRCRRHDAANCDSPACAAGSESWRATAGSSATPWRGSRRLGRPDGLRLGRPRLQARRGGSGHCQVMTAAQWARLDPENAAPWLAVAARRRREKDATALDDAMFHVAAAERHDPGWSALAAIVIDHAPRDDANLSDRRRCRARVVGIEAARLPRLQPDVRSTAALKELSAIRTGARPASGSRPCSRSARRPCWRGPSATALGRRVGWPERATASALAGAERAPYGRPCDGPQSTRWSASLRRTTKSSACATLPIRRDRDASTRDRGDGQPGRELAPRAASPAEADARGVATGSRLRHPRPLPRARLRRAPR